MPLETIAIIALLLLNAVLCLILVLRGGKQVSPADLDKMKKEIYEELRASRQETIASVANSVKNYSDAQVAQQQQTAAQQDKRLYEMTDAIARRQDALQKTVTASLTQVDERFKTSSLQSEQKLENIRVTVEKRLSSLQEDNSKKLEEMRATVDEKLQKTLENRITQSFNLVNERLEQVYKGLGEMQTLASGVGDLKKVLSNVKTRGILGEIQLGAILEQILAPAQYDENVATKKGSSDRVEFAVKFPTEEGDGFVYLPIDAKFPADAYGNLMDAYDAGDPAAVEAAGALLEKRIKAFAKDIRDKYISPPETTDFGIMFLPVEGLYAEVVRRGMVETLQNEYKVNIAGPTTMAALLNSLQMGFKTLAIQKRSGEVWNILGAVKTEFTTFGNVLEQAQNRITQASAEIDKLVGTRTRQIQRKLRGVTALDEDSAARLLDTADPSTVPDVEL